MARHREDRHRVRARLGFQQHLAHLEPCLLVLEVHHQVLEHPLEVEHHLGHWLEAYRHQEHQHQVDQEILAQGNPSASIKGVQRLGFFWST